MQKPCQIAVISYITAGLTVSKVDSATKTPTLGVTVIRGTSVGEPMMIREPSVLKTPM